MFMKNNDLPGYRNPRKYQGVMTEQEAKKKDRVYKESGEQGTVAGHLKKHYPHIVFHTSTTESVKSYGAQNRLKKQNSEPGYPDTTIFMPNGIVLLIEQKPLGTDLTLKDGKTLASDHLQHQYKCHLRLFALGHRAYFAVGVQEAIHIVDNAVQGIFRTQQIFTLRVDKTQRAADDFFDKLHL
jgi:hypothetical protein